MGRFVLLTVSIAVSYAAAEAAVRRWSPLVPPGAYEQRYLIDGATADALGWFDTRDPILPIALRPGYDHRVADVAWHPTAFRVRIDKYGYRNDDRQGTPVLAVVGDSVVFGYGVERVDTLPGALERIMGQRVDNLGIPNVGPESYPVILERYARRPQHAASVLVVVYAGNDWQNLADSTWGEASACRIAESKIYRRDIDEFAPNLPPLFLTTPFKHSEFATLFAGSLTSLRVTAPWQMADVHRLSALGAIDTLHVLAPTEGEKQEAIGQARTFRDMVASQSCTTDQDREALDEHAAALGAGDFRRAADIGRRVVRDLVERGCERVNPSMLLNPVSWFSEYGDYFWRRIDEGADGPLRAYGLLLSTMAKQPEFSPFRDRLIALDNRLRRPDRSAESQIEELAATIDASFPPPFAAPPVNCDRLTVALTTMRDTAAAHDIHLSVAYSVSERQVQTLGDTFVQGHELCRMLQSQGVPCLNLAPSLARESRGGGPALYLDGAHFSKAGNAFAAQQIASWMGQPPAEP